MDYVSIMIENEDEKFNNALLSKIENKLKRIPNLEGSWKSYASTGLGVKGIAIN